MVGVDAHERHTAVAEGTTEGTSAGISAWQIVHQLAQTFTSVTRPRNDSVVTVSPPLVANTMRGNVSRSRGVTPVSKRVASRR